MISYFNCKIELDYVFAFCAFSMFAEVLQEPAVMAKISDTKAASEVKLLESFYTMLQLEPAKAFYGKKHVDSANEAMAIETLMISDKLFRYYNEINVPLQASFYLYIYVCKHVRER